MRHSTIRLAVPVAALAGGATALYFLRKSHIASHPEDDAPRQAERWREIGQDLVVGRAVTIDAPRAELFAMWKDTAELPRFLQNVRSVSRDGSGLWRWQIRGEDGDDFELATEVIEERENELIAWRSLTNAPVDAEARISFRDAPGGRGTIVEATVAYRPPGGRPGHWISKLFRADPETQGRHELKRLKMLVETGEIATAANQRQGGS